MLCGAPDELVEQAVEQIRPHVDQVATYGTVWSMGSTAYFVGSGLLALGRTDEAVAMLERAVARERRGGLRQGRAAGPAPAGRGDRLTLSEPPGSPDRSGTRLVRVLVSVLALSP